MRIDQQLVFAERCDNVDHGPHLLFGSRATDVGVAEWERVTFAVGKPETLLVPFSRPPSSLSVFQSGKDGYHTYRTPALVVTKKGTLLAFAHGRKESVHDLGNQDMILKRSTDQGRTWSAMQVLIDEGEATVSTPAPIFDGNNISRLTSRDPQRPNELRLFGWRVTIHELREHLGGSKTNGFRIRDHTREWWRANAAQEPIIVDSNHRHFFGHSKVKCRAGVDYVLAANIVAGHHRKRRSELLQPVNETLLLVFPGPSRSSMPG